MGGTHLVLPVEPDILSLGTEDSLGVGWTDKKGRQAGSLLKLSVSSQPLWILPATGVMLRNKTPSPTSIRICFLVLSLPLLPSPLF